MTENQFRTYGYRHSEIIIFHQKHPEVDVECILLAVNFETDMFKLYPFDQELYEDYSFWIPYTYCDKKAKKPKMKIIRSNEKIKEYSKI